MVQYLVLIGKLPVIPEVSHRVRVPHGVTCFLSRKKGETLRSFCRKVLFYLESIVDIDVPVFLFDIADELVEWLHLFEIIHGTYNNQFLFSM